MIKVDVLQDNAAQLGVTSRDIATALNGMMGGSTITEVRDRTYLVPIIERAKDEERSSI